MRSLCCRLASFWRRRQQHFEQRPHRGLAGVEEPVEAIAGMW
jgi:hypothetical protein